MENLGVGRVPVWNLNASFTRSTWGVKSVVGLRVEAEVRLDTKKLEVFALNARTYICKKFILGT